MDWGRELLSWALAKRNRVRREQNVGPGALGKQVEDVLAAAPARSRERLRTLAGRITEITQADGAAVAQALRAVVDATDVKSAERVAADLSLEGDPDDAVTWELLGEARDIVRAGTRTLQAARRDALANFLLAVSEPPVNRLHRELPNAPWLISPLLADVPHEVLRVDDELACVKFAALPPVLDALTILCWAVGLDPSPQPAHDLQATLQIASAWPQQAPGQLTWTQVLNDSSEAHEALLASLEEQS